MAIHSHIRSFLCSAEELGWENEPHHSPSPRRCTIERAMSEHSSAMQSQIARNTRQATTKTIPHDSLVTDRRSSKESDSRAAAQWSADFSIRGSSTGDENFPRQPVLITSKTWSPGPRVCLQTATSSNFGRHASFSVPPMRQEPDDPETAHTKRRVSLSSKLYALAKSCQGLYSRIHDITQRMSTLAVRENLTLWMRLMRLYAWTALEVFDLKWSAVCFDIHRLSSFWVKAWRGLFDLGRCVEDIREIFQDLEVDYEVRRSGNMSSQDIIDGFRLQFFHRRLIDSVSNSERAAKLIHDINCFAIQEHKRPVRQAQPIEGEWQQPDALERMAMRRLVPPSLQRGADRARESDREIKLHR